MIRTISRKNLLAGLATAGVLGVGIAAPTIAFADSGASPSSAPSTSAPSTDQSTPATDQGGTPSTDQGGTSDRAQHESDFAAALAKELGISQDRVTTALQKVREQLKPAGKSDGDRAADRQAAISDRIAQAVKDGKLTQEQADAITKAIESGVFPAGAGHGHGGPDASRDQSSTPQNGQSATPQR